MGRSVDWPLRQSLDEILGNRTAFGLEETVRIRVDDLATQIAQLVSVGAVQTEAYPALAAIAGSRVGQPGRVVGPDAGTHTDPTNGNTVPNEGEYRWVGSPTGWRWISGLNDRIVRTYNAGAGTANAVQVTANQRFSTAPFDALLAIHFRATNTGAMTLSVDGATPRELVLNNGLPIPPGSVQDGMMALVLIDLDGKWRFFTHGNAEAVQAIVEAIYAQAITIRDIVLGAMTAVIDPQYSTKALAEAVPFPAFPSEIRTAFLDTDQVPGSGAQWGKPVDTEPSHAAKLEATLADGVTKKWYVLRSRSIKVRSISSNDDVAVTTALRSDVHEGRVIDFGYESFTLTQAISRTLSSNLIIRGDDALIECDPAAHLQKLITINVGGTKRKIDIEGIDLSAAAKANVGMEIRNEVASMAAANLAEVRVRAMFRDARRIAAAGVGGAGLDVVGGFSRVHFDHAQAKDCVLPAGQGTSGSQGIAGLRCRSISSSIPLLFIQEHCEVARVRTEDPYYNWDQDAISYTVGNRAELDTVCRSIGGVFTNNPGRSLKLQCSWADVDGAHDIRTVSYQNSPKDEAIDLQLTGGNIRNCTGYYDGARPSRFVRSSGRASSFPPADTRLLDLTVRLGPGTPAFGDFATIWSDDAVLGESLMKGCRLYGGSVRNMLDYRCNGPTNILYYEQNWAQEYSADADGERAAIRVTGTGPLSPNNVRIVTRDLHYDGSEAVHVIKDNISGVVAIATHSAEGEHRGFVNSRSGAVTTSGLRTTLSNTFGMMGAAADPRSRVVVDRLNFPDSTEVTLPINLTSGPFLFFMINSTSRTHRAILSIDNSGHDSFFVGSNTQIGSGANPGSGAFRMWRSNTNEMRFWHNTGASRRLTIFEINGS